MWGYRIDDIAMAMLHLWDQVNPPTYDRLLDAFHRGIHHHDKLAEGDLTLFQLGRYIWRLNWVARHRSDGIAEALKSTAHAFRQTCSRPNASNQKPAS